MTGVGSVSLRSATGSTPQPQSVLPSSVFHPWLKNPCPNPWHNTVNRSRLAAGLALALALALAFLPATSVRGAELADVVEDAGKPQVWAVIVGIDLHEDPAIPRCRGAKRDGGALARWFTETAQWGSAHVLLMNDNGPAGHGPPEEPIRALRPTRANLNWALTQWLGHRLRPGDVAVVYFAGRSAVVDDRELLLPFDARAANLDQTGWSPEEALDALARKSQATLLTWLDIAPLAPDGHAAVAAADPKPAPASAPAPTAGVRLLNRLTRWPGASAWRTYGRPDGDADRAGEGDNAGPAPGEAHGPFVSALIEGLGDRPNNLASCLDRMLQDAPLKRLGFRARGGLSPLLTLWPGRLLPAHQFKPSLLLQLGHADAVSAVATSADGETMITASLDSTIRIWRVREGVRVLIRVLAHHTIGVTALALAPDGRHLASGDGSGLVRVWDLAEERETPRDGPPLHHERITALAFFPDKAGARFVSLDQAGQSMLWDASGPRLEGKPFLAIDLVRLSAAKREGPAALALAEPDGKLVLIPGVDGPKTFLDGTGGRSSALHLAPDGRRVAAGDEDGGVRVWDVETGAIVFRHDYGARVGAIRLGPSGRLAVGAGDRLYLADVRSRVGPGLALEGIGVGDDVDSAVFSGDGRWLAALTNAGNRHLWDAIDLSRPEIRALPAEGRSAGVTCLGFARDDRSLFAGEGDGAVRVWDLLDGRERLRIPPHRGKVEGLSVSADNRDLLEVTGDGYALIWDLKEGRGARTLPGRWTSGAFLPDGSRLAMVRASGEGGDVVLVDREGGKPILTFDRPRLPGGREPSRVVFGRVAVAPDGRTLAAAAAPGQVEIVCIWDVAGGPPRVLRGHSRTINALAFSGDGTSLLTASEDGTAKLWPLAPGSPAPEQPSAVFNVGPGRAVAAAQVGPGASPRVVTADWAPGQTGRVIVWDWQPGQPPRPLRLGELSRRPHAVTFTPDGRWVIAAGQDKMLYLWTIDGPRAERVRLDPEHQHAEQIQALAVWSGAVGPVFASGGDDTTVRLWSLDPKEHRGTLVGTLVADPAALGEDAGQEPAPPKNPAPARGRFTAASASVSVPTWADWVAFTPDGVYDSSLDGDRMVSFVIGQDVRRLEQYAGQFRKFQLTDDLRKGTRPQPPAHTAPPPLVIDPPPAPDIRTRDTELRISLADASLANEGLRLYQNGMPVQDRRDFRPLEGPGKYAYAVRVRLRSGPNRFYAMASRPNDVDARSDDVVIRYDGPETPGQFHILALGVKDYARNALRYASNDAVEIADHLHKYGVEGLDRPGKKIVLTDDKVSEASVEKAFMDLRRAVKGRPEDTVVIFLAGHTDVLIDPSGRERFSLLLPSFPFPANAPAMADNRGVGIAGRGANANANANANAGPIPSGTDLPFYVIYRNLSHLDALQRLIIIDACQAEAIDNDPRVRRIRQVLETDTHRARTSYLLAARRGEPANESALLEHGLLTYVLLRGMEAPGLRPLPLPLTPLRGGPQRRCRRRRDRDHPRAARLRRPDAPRTLEPPPRPGAAERTRRPRHPPGPPPCPVLRRRRLPTHPVAHRRARRPRALIRPCDRSKGGFTNKDTETSKK